ncbi:MAG: AsnC family transcriptional regulator [Rhodocyclaceae bacterium]|nr:AsnC family transcriptional regulator [Rhodocyclaceae bacterium]
MAGERPAVAIDTLDEIDRRIINALQGDFPLSDEPYREAAESLGLSETELLARLKRMLDERVLTRFGPMFQIERMGGRFVLAAMQVPEADFNRVADLVNSFPEVAHNYRREHAFNMWFVLATEKPEGIADAVARIEAATGIGVAAFPKEREYFVEMKLDAS